MTDEQIITLNAGERFFSETPSKYPEAGHGTQYHCGQPGLIGFARGVEREVLAAMASAPPVAWEYQNQHGNKFLSETDPHKWHPHDQAGFKEFRALVYAPPPPRQTIRSLLEEQARCRNRDAQIEKQIRDLIAGSSEGGADAW